MTEQEVADTVGRLHALLKEPHPGLFSWNRAVIDCIQALTGWWEGLKAAEVVRRATSEENPK